LKKKPKQFTHAQQATEAEFYPKTGKSHRHFCRFLGKIRPLLLVVRVWIVLVFLFSTCVLQVVLIGLGLGLGFVKDAEIRLGLGW